MRTIWKRMVILGLVFLLIISLSACGGNDGASSASKYNETEALTGGDANFAPHEESASATAEDVPADMSQNAVSPLSENRKLITTVSLEAETKEYDSFLSWLDTRLDEAGGYIENSEMYSYNEESRRCNLRIRVPAAQLDGFLNSMGEACNVLWRSVSEDDITLQYVDAQSYRDALRVEQERLMELLEQAESLEDILSLEDRLTTVRYQLQNYESTLRVYDNQVDYATVNLDLREVRELTEPVPETWGSRALAGMAENAQDIGIFFQELGLFIVTHLPTLGLLGCIAVIVLLCTVKPRRRARERRRQQKEMIRAMQQQAAPQEDKKD